MVDGRGVVAVVGLATLLAASTCKPTVDDPERDGLRQPTGLALSPDAARLFVTCGNWDLQDSAGTLVSIDLERLTLAIEQAEDSSASPCHRDEEGEVTVLCDPAEFIDASTTRIVGSAVATLAVDDGPGGADGRFRLLAVQRSPGAVLWFDVATREEDYAVDCGEDAEGRCDAIHAISNNQATGVALPGDPSTIMVDDEQYRFAYVPHLVGGGLSLFTLDGEHGPELANVSAEFFATDPFADLDVSGGFAVALRACDPGRPPAVARDCARPFLLATHRYWPGTRGFTVAPGLELILPGDNVAIEPIGSDNAQSGPLMGDLEFEDPDLGERLLVVQTTPGALTRVDTSLDAEGLPRFEPLATVALCSDPNMLSVHRPVDRPPVALVTCFGDGQLAVIDLSSFTVVETVELGAGANEILVDSSRGWAYVANTIEGTISVVGLEPSRPGYLRERARIGLGPHSR